MSMKFLLAFLGRYFVGKLVVTSRIVGWLVRLETPSWLAATWQVGQVGAGGQDGAKKERDLDSERRQMFVLPNYYGRGYVSCKPAIKTKQLSLICFICWKCGVVLFCNLYQGTQGTHQRTQFISSPVRFKWYWHPTKHDVFSIYLITVTSLSLTYAPYFILVEDKEHSNINNKKLLPCRSCLHAISPFWQSPASCTQKETRDRGTEKNFFSALCGYVARSRVLARLASWIWELAPLLISITEIIKIINGKNRKIYMYV